MAMDKLMTAKLLTKYGTEVKLYRHNETNTGIHVAPNNPRIFEVTIEQMLHGLKLRGYKVLETRTAFKERELGDSDEEYMTIKRFD